MCKKDPYQHTPPRKEINKAAAAEVCCQTVLEIVNKLDKSGGNIFKRQYNLEVKRETTNKKLKMWVYTSTCTHVSL
jgi:hypothetical protein